MIGTDGYPQAAWSRFGFEADDVKRFSQRKGLKPVKTKMQLNDMDSELRNALWNTLTVHYWHKVRDPWIRHNPEIEVLFISLWHGYFKWPIDTLDDYWEHTYKKVREYFFQSQWFEVYDFVEFVASNFPDELENREFMKICNAVLESELSAYRFVGDKIVQMTSPDEIAEIEKALQVKGALDPVRNHLERALDLLSDRRTPDYRNSIKESISSVEAICRLITGDANATLGQALKQLEDKHIALHGALKNAFSSLYGYTSSAQGIRHALLEETSLGFEDAKFMLISCSAFTNYLIVKSSKAGISF